MNQESVLKILDSLYTQSLDGIPHVSPTIEEFASDYLEKHPNPKIAAKSMFKHQIVKCTTSGVVTGLGGFITLPVAIPANIGSVLYVQMRMIACAAYMGGHDVRSDQVQTFIYACLAGVSINKVVKRFGVEFGQKIATKGIQRIPGKVITQINQKIGFRLLTKFGKTGLVNLGKMVPVVGAGINGGLDLIETKAIAKRAYKMFVENDYSVGEDVIDFADLEIVDEQSE